MKHLRLTMALAASVTLAGACTEFPELDRTLTPALVSSDYPDLVPIAPILAAAERSTTDPEQTGAEIDARVAALKARAARLGGSVLSGRERQRLAQGLR